MPQFQTSGTTGNPKAYILTSEMITARVADLPRVRPPGWTDLTSLYNDYGDRPGVSRDTEWLKDRGTLYRPLATFDATVRQFIDNHVQGVFAPARGLMRFAPALIGSGYAPLIVACSSNTLTAEMSKAIRSGFGDVLWNVYSIGECGGISMATAAQVEEGPPGCVGTVCKGVELRFVNGEIQVKTPIMITEYVDPAMTAAKFMDGWFRTGDRGRMDGGMLVLEGRM